MPRPVRMLLLSSTSVPVEALEFYRGKEAIAAGRVVARERLTEIKALLADRNGSPDAAQPSVG